MPSVLSAVAALSPTVLPQPQQHCAGCGAAPHPRMPRCGACFSVRYCGRACCVRHWPQHRDHCRLLCLRAMPVALLREQLPANMAVWLGDSGGDGVAVCAMSVVYVRITGASTLAAMRAALAELHRGGQRMPATWRLLDALHSMEWASRCPPAEAAMQLLAAARAVPADARPPLQLPPRGV